MLSSFLFLLILLSLLYPYKIKDYPAFVDWRTIIALAGLLIITTGIKESGYFYNISKQILIKLKSERGLCLFLILLSALLSPILTNDITLFIVVPLTLSLQRFLKNGIKKIVIFEAIAVNVGSSLTPIGNPQNLFLWGKWNISLWDFVLKMLPLVALLLLLLLLFAIFVFDNKKLKIENGMEDKIHIKKDLFVLSFVLMAIYLFSFELGWTHYLLPIIFFLYFILYRDVLPKVDWPLLLIFIIIFIDFHLISEIRLISDFVNGLDLTTSANVFGFSLLSSQIISNVPASVFLSRFSNNWFAIAYGINVGGNGIAIASLANIIALRIVKDKGIWLDFHKYSLIYLAVSGILVYAMFFALNLS